MGPDRTSKATKITSSAPGRGDQVFEGWTPRAGQQDHRHRLQLLRGDDAVGHHHERRGEFPGWTLVTRRSIWACRRK